MPIFKHLLVPLDGSPMAEAALAPAVAIARLLGARLTLLHVLEDDPPAAIHGQPHLTSLEAAYHYLDTVAARLPADLPVTVHAHPNPEHDVTRSLVAHAHELAADLIVLCTHGRGSLRHRIFGSLADAVINQGRLPVLVVQPADGAQQAPAFAPRRILAPLDGSPHHEGGLDVAVALAAPAHAALDLLVVIPTLSTLTLEGAATARMLPAATRAALEISEENAALYLQERAQRLTADGLTVTTLVRRGDPVALIAQEAGARSADLIVMATHGKSHVDALFAGSVAPHVMERTQRPLLLVPAHR